MHRAQGNKDVAVLECTSPRRNKWRVRWDVQENDGGSASYMEEEFNHRPTEEEIRSLVMSWYNDAIDTEILSGFKYDGMPVWLSSENQFNYKSAYDLAVQTNGATLPVTFKLGTDEKPEYCTFSTVEDLQKFYTAAANHIQKTLSEGWKKKDAFDLSKYAIS